MYLGTLLYAVQFNVFISLWFLDAIWIYIENQNLKNEKKSTVAIFSWTGQFLSIVESLFLSCGSLKSFTKSYTFQLTNCEHIGVSKSIDSDDRDFSSVKPQQIFQVF